MRLEIRLYKRHDVDLLALRQQGFPIITLMKSALNAYAKGFPVKFLLPSFGEFDITKLKGIHSRMDVNDPDAIALLRKIDSGHWNEFCKAVLRESLVYMPLAIFMRNRELVKKEEERIRMINLDQIPNLILCQADIPKRNYLDEVLVYAGEKKPRRKKQKDNGLKMVRYRGSQEAEREEVTQKGSEYTTEHMVVQGNNPELSAPPADALEHAPSIMAPESVLLEGTDTDASDAAMSADEQEELMDMIKDIF